MDILLGVFMRWVHIASMAILLGGVVFARFVLREDVRHSRAFQLAQDFRPWIYVTIAALLGSGLYNFLTKGFYPLGYHVLFGLKILLVLHIFAAMILFSVPGGTAEKRDRSLTGVIISGFIVLLLSACLRWLSLHATR